ncbi:MAG: thiamine pyrophosphate-binding protein [Armatimonadota bacterium]|nr:thiamine pyrophosphate-binding protein [Armatimonadota bacterium]MDR7449612.1 thiamine pyrophosphate-binding protein [Armatimonadota bacterium]MDR7460349.1 thiamine pyrophosphate-binding protein [Armatimonadota bacterium]MDR7488082.1 thiamine pyrophosphate-binding protein [Armatimonadota bacterium]MDR7492117.1 thiamine pyrophosphate-binding protein [Armatimonadota bacterium]
MSQGKYGSDLIVDLMRAYDIEYAALNPGATFRGLHDSIVNYGGNQRPQLILCTHEEIAVAVAQGYAKAAGRPMAAIVHDVVGLLHATMAIYTAWLDRTPVLVLGGTGPMPVEARRPWIDWIHTALVQGNAVRDYVKWDDQPASLQGFVESFIRGYRIATTEPQGPVYLCFDAGLQEAPLTEAIAIPDVRRYAPPARPQADPAALETLTQWLVEAEHPVVLADYVGRTPQAVRALVGLAETLALPVVDLGSRFNFPNTHPLDLTGAEEELLPEADLVLALDTFDLQKALSTTDRTWRRARPLLRPQARVAHISLADAMVRSWIQEQGRLEAVDLAVMADTALALPALTERCARAVAGDPALRARVEERREALARRHRALRDGWREAAERRRGERPIALAHLALELWDVVRDEDWVLVNRSLRGWTRRLWTWALNGEDVPYVGAHRGGGVGSGAGHAIGAALALGRRRLCIDIQPDGDLLYTPSALWTAAHHRIPLLVVMFNNRSYYNDEEHQRLVAQARGRAVERAHIGQAMVDPPVDFAGLARAFGLEAWGPVEAPEGLRPTLERAVRYVLRERRPALVDVVMQSR